MRRLAAIRSAVAITSLCAVVGALGVLRGGGLAVTAPAHHETAASYVTRLANLHGIPFPGGYVDLAAKHAVTTPEPVYSSSKRAGSPAA